MELEAVLQWAELVRGIVGIDKVAITLAIIWVESRGKPDVINARSGATGLMQIMPYDPERTGEMFVGRPTSEELCESEVNVKWGIRILRYYYKEEGDLWGALYRYSGGKTWESYADFNKRYWVPFSKARGEIGAAMKEMDVAGE